MIGFAVVGVESSQKLALWGEFKDEIAAGQAVTPSEAVVVALVGGRILNVAEKERCVTVAKSWA